MTTGYDAPKGTAVIRTDPSGAEAVLVASWVAAAYPDLRPDLVDSETVRFQYDGATQPMGRLHQLLSEPRFDGWTVSAASPASD